MSSLPEIFSPDGPLAQAISGYRVRDQQLDMAERIAAIDSCSVFIAEAGSGTGKTLQGQQFNKDLPMVRDALKAPVRISLAERARRLRLPLSPRGVKEARRKKRKKGTDHGFYSNGW